MSEKFHAKIEFFIKNNKILKFFSFSKNKSCVSKFWDFLQKLTLFLKFARKMGGQKRWWSSSLLFFLSTFLCFKPDSRATKRVRPEASEARPSASLRSELRQNWQSVYLYKNGLAYHGKCCFKIYFKRIVGQLFWGKKTISLFINFLLFYIFHFFDQHVHQNPNKIIFWGKMRLPVHIYVRLRPVYFCSTWSPTNKQETFCVNLYKLSPAHASLAISLEGTNNMAKKQNISNAVQFA